MKNEIDKFMKCDLHVHSSSCYSRDYTKAEFIKKLKESDLDVISITDHNIIDIDLYNELLKDKEFEKYIIGGIELNIKLSNETIQKYQLNVKGDYFHGILWFDINEKERVWEILKDIIREEIVELKDIDDMEITEISKMMQGKAIILEKVQEKLSEINYYFVFHEGKGDRNLSDYLKNNGKHNEAFKEKLFYYNNSLAIEGGRKSKPISDFFENELNILVSRFFFSDAKSIDEIGSKYTWINFDGTFKNLLLPLSDPKVRIFTSDEFANNPQENKEDYLEAIKFNTIGKDGDKTNTIYFSPALNGIIGSRGSGKTLLGNILGNEDIELYKDYIDIKSIEYKMRDGNFTKNIPKNKYLKQNTLLKIYERGKFEELDFIKESYNELLEKKKEKVIAITESITKKLISEKNEILQFRDKYKGNIIFWDFIRECKNGNELLNCIDKSEFSDNVKELENIKEILKKIDKNIDSIQEEVNKIEFSNEYKESAELFELIENYKKTYSKNISELKDSNRKINNIDENTIKNMKKRNILLNLMIELTKKENSKIDNKSFVFETHMKELEEFFVESYKIRKSLEKNYNDIEVEYDKIFDNNDKISLKINDTDDIIVTTSLDYKTVYRDTIKEQIKINDYENYSDYIYKILLDSNSQEKYKSNFNGNKFRGMDDFSEYINKYYDNIISNIEKIKNIKLKILYNEKELEKYSPGKRTEILLEIFLHDSVIKNNEYKYIILDQPEDNLDTNTIIIKLVNKIRNIKSKKQIFIISHSAPIIINADSNNIICAKENNNQISYNQGKINENHLKDDIVTILDGGEKNLKIRLHKYDFNYKEEKE